jgi:hypothetical protein
MKPRNHKRRACGEETPDEAGSQKARKIQASTHGSGFPGFLLHHASSAYFKMLPPRTKESPQARLAPDASSILPQQERGPWSDPHAPFPFIRKAKRK